ncbi:hypothetical protein GCM10009743_23380 [Kribbella swartbergensis]
MDQPKDPTDRHPSPGQAVAANGADVLALVADHTTAPPPTDTVTTPLRVRHLYYRQPINVKLCNSAGRIGWKIDTRGHGGYVVGAGSITAADRYRTQTAIAPQLLPSWIIDALHTAPPTATVAPTTLTLANTSAYTLAALTGELEKVLAAVQGQRNDTLNRAAFALGQLIGAHMLDHHIARDELVSAAHRIGLPRNEAERTITSGLLADAAMSMPVRWFGRP